ncbi:MAG TPA: metal ABC transporter substrate-binding protein [Candidatus Avilachnospira avistercoris]|nr:metal ABC transporter substrate-binding protein [Candidatus Avilachnospira avistercoris]
MKRSTLLTTAIAITAVLSLTACGGSKEETTAAATEAAAETEAAADTEEAAEADPEELVEIVVGASPAPHAEILAAAEPVLNEAGYTLDIVEYTDYVQPNLALEAGELDANYFQHGPYLEQFNVEQGTDLVSAGTIHYEPFGIYAGKTASLEELADGATVAVPNDTTNEARALLLLEAQGLLTLKEGAGLDATKNDIVENPKDLDILEVEAAQIPLSLQDVDIAVINGNYAIDAGLKVSDALAVEASDSEAAVTYGNVVAVKAGEETSDKALALVEALKSDTVKSFIEETYEGAVVPMF